MKKNTEKEIQRAFEKEMRVRGKRAYYKHVAGEVFTFVGVVLGTALGLALLFGVMAVTN